MGEKNEPELSDLLTSFPSKNSCVDLLNIRRKTSDMKCQPIPLAETRLWQRENGKLAHKTGGFFSLIGLRGISVSGESYNEQPFIHQPEVGILGNLIRNRDGNPQILVQAKSEPGNVGSVQFSPTVQATVSNYTRVHKGAPTPYLNHFLSPKSNSVFSDSLQSEQGNRFFGKYNRNLTVLVNGDGPDPVSGVWHWCDVDSLLRALPIEFAVNTDLRSVLAVSDWDLLAGEEKPFECWRSRGGFGEALFESLFAINDKCVLPMADILAFLKRLRAKAPPGPAGCSLTNLAGWNLNDERLVDEEEKLFEVRGYRVQAPDREITHWDQPLVRDLGLGKVLLACQIRNGILHFLLRPSWEMGFLEGVQFGPSHQKPQTLEIFPPSDVFDPVYDFILQGDYTEHISTHFSEEGGRFFQSISLYQIVEFPESALIADSDEYCWVTLGQIRQLLKSPGNFTNEARSAIALLLSYLPGPS